jgi:uncharacterized protein GlcG (DUF336 family)
MTQLTLQLANRLIDTAINKARELELPPIGVAVVDRGGHLIALQREDGQAFLRVEVCQAKAWAAVALQSPTREIAKRYEKGGRDSGFIDQLNAMSGGRMVPLPGGVLIHNQTGDIIGAVGVAGAASELDEACAAAGIEAIGFNAGIDLEP